jgi:hypothetical protein
VERRSGVLVRRRRRKQWWKAFASPRLMVIAVPALIFPLASVAVYESEPAPLSPVEQAIDALPLSPVGASAIGSGGPGDVSPLGAGSARLQPALALKLAANSAGSRTAVMALRNSELAPQDADRDFSLAEFSLLHPKSRSGDNYLIGDLALVYANPADSNLTADIYNAFCSARPSDPYYMVGVADLPIPLVLKLDIVKWQATPGTNGRCPGLAG